MLLGIAALGLGINAWFLVPLITYRDTIKYSPTVGLAYPEFTRPDAIFSLFPRSPFADAPDGLAQLYTQPPLIPLAAAALVIVSAVPFVRRRRLFALAMTVGLGFTAIFLWMTDTLWRFSWWDWLPQSLQVIQFPYRLSSYVLLCAAGLTLVACRYAAHVHGTRPRVGGVLHGLLAAATVAQVSFGLHQVWTARTYGPAGRVLADLDHLPSAWYDRNYFNDSVLKLDAVQPERPWIKTFGPSFDVDTVGLTYPQQLAGREVKTNIVPSPLIELHPAQAFTGQFQDYAVVRVPKAKSGSHSSNAAAVRVQVAHTPATTIGTLTTFACLIGAGLLLGYLTCRGAWQRVSSGHSRLPLVQLKRPIARAGSTHLELRHSPSNETARFGGPPINGC